MHTFLECDAPISVFSSTTKFNDIHQSNVIPSAEQIIFNLTDEIAPLTSIQKRRLDLLLPLIKHYLYFQYLWTSNKTSNAMENWTLFSDLILQFSP